MVMAVPLAYRSFTLLSLLFCILCYEGIVFPSQHQQGQAKMKIKAKKINSASENAIQSSVFVFQWKPIVTN